MPAEIAKKTMVYRVPNMDAVRVRRDVEFQPAEGGPLLMDLYFPPDTGRPPLVVLVLGWADVDVPLPLGCQFREMGMAVSLAQLLAASGMVGVIYQARNPVADLDAVLAHLRENEDALGIDGTRIGIWAVSGNVPVAVAALMGGQARCGVLSSGYMFDLDGATGVAKAAAEYGFANPLAGRQVEDLRGGTALFIVRCGLEQFAAVNESIDSFMAKALPRNLPVTLLNHATGTHGFELSDDSKASRDVVRAMLGFLGDKLEA